MRDPSFDATAKSILDRFDPGQARKRRPDRPFMVELFGTTNSGKTSVMDKLYVAFKAAGFETAKVPEGAEAVPPPRILPVYNFMTADYAVKHAREYALDRNLHLVLFDRAICDAAVRMETFARDGQMTPDERDAFQACYLSRWNRELFDLHVCMVTSPEVGLVRKYGSDHTTTAKYSTTTNPDSMAKALDTHQHVWNNVLAPSPLPGNLLWLDTSVLTIDQAADAIKNAMAEAFLQRLRQLHSTTP